MSWVLQITPQGEILNKYLKNNFLNNTSSVLNVERNHFLSDFYSENSTSNTVDIKFALDIYDDNPINRLAKPNILGIANISISNDSNFNDVITLTPNIFANYYNNQTDYTVDLSVYNIAQLNFVSAFSPAFVETSGSGLVVLKNWPLSGSTGVKKVYIRLNVELSDGTTANYPLNYDSFDEITVFAASVFSPGEPKLLSRSINENKDYSVLPVTFASNPSSNSGSSFDPGISAYFWDSLFLNSSSTIYRNNTNVKFDLFPNSTLPILNNDTNVPTVSSSSITQNSSNLFNFATNSNIFFYECKVANTFSTNYVANTTILTYKHSLLNNSGTELFSSSIAFPDSDKSFTVTVTSSGLTNTFSNTNATLSSQLLYGGTIIYLIECIDISNAVFQFKILYRNDSLSTYSVLVDTLLSNTSLNSVSFKNKFEIQLQNVSGNLSFEANQYGLCYGIISASVLPQENLVSNLLFSNVNTNYSLIYSSPLSGNILLNSDNSITLFNGYSTNLNNSNNTIIACEIQSKVPTFSENNTLSLTLNQVNSYTTNPKTSWSFDNNLNFNDFTAFNSSIGLVLPQPTIAYTIQSNLIWSDSSNFDFNIYDVGVGDTCNLSNYTSTNFYHLNLSSPQIIRSKGNLSTSSGYNFWLNTNGASTSSIQNFNLVFINNGQNNITVSGTGLNTLVAGQALLISSISTQSASPTAINVISNTKLPTNSVNFLIDSGSTNAQITNFSLLITTGFLTSQYSPNIDYSLEYSNDFLSWTQINSSPSVSVVNSSQIKISFDSLSVAGRFLRLRFYKTSSSFDPTTNNTYSNFVLVTSGNSFSNSGKLFFGFTDTQSSSASLGSLYNKPTYLRQFQQNNSNFYGLLLDFTDYNSTNKGPVYLSSVSNSGEKRIKTFANNFDLSYNYYINLSLSRQKIKNTYKTQPYFSISTSSTSYNLLDEFSNEILPSFLNQQNFDFGLYPFISLVGNGYFNVSNVVKSILPALSADEERLVLLNSKDPKESVNYGKNLLWQNSYNPSLLQYPLIGNYFSLNSIKSFSYLNNLFTVRLVSTEPLVLFSDAVIDGVYVKSGDYILITAQSDKTQNGIWQASDNQWTQIFASFDTVYVSEGIIFNDTLWMYDLYYQEWISNVIATQFVLDNNSLINSNSKNLLYPSFVKLALNNLVNSSISKIKLVRSNNGYISKNDIATNWISNSNNQTFSALNSNQLNFYNYEGFSISTSQILGIATNSFPSVYTLLLQINSVYPYFTENSKITIQNYGTPYRIFNVPLLIGQMFSTYENTSFSSLTNNTNVLSDFTLQTSIYSINCANSISKQSKISKEVYLNNIAPVLPTLIKVQDNVKNVVLGFQSSISSSNDLLLARIVQRNPLNEVFYGSWFGFNTSSLSGVSTFVAFPNFFYSLATSTLSNNSFVSSLGEPYTGYYKYSIDVMDAVGNITRSNEVESFYYEQAIVDTQAPVASVSFVDSSTHKSISISSSSVVTTQLIAQDYSTAVKAFRYRFYGQSWSAWINYVEFSDLIVPSNFPDGTISVEFQFKDYADNYIGNNSTIVDDNVYTYSWNIISKLISNVTFTVMTSYTLLNNTQILLIGATKNGSATLFTWDGNVLTEISYASFAFSKAITAMMNVNDALVVIGTDQGYVYTFQNGIILGYHTQLMWVNIPLSISSFELNTFSGETQEYLFAATLNIPRIFYTPSSQVTNKTWSIIQPDPISLTSINFTNSGLWANNNFTYSISSSYAPAQLYLAPVYGISSVIISNYGSGYSGISTIIISGAISNASVSPVMQGKVISYNVVANGLGYTNGVNVIVDSPGSGVNTSQALAIANTDSSGTIQSVLVYNGAYGYGYTQVPKVTLVGVNGFGSSGAVQAVIQYDSIKYANVISSGVGSTTQISLALQDPTGSGQNAVLIPDFTYSISSALITNPGFGYTSSPTLIINGISTIATVSVANGSVSSVSISTNGLKFSKNTPLTYSFSGGTSRNWQGTFVTSPVSYFDGTTTQTGVALTAITLTDGGYGFGAAPQINFYNYLFAPKYDFVYSNDLLLNSSSGSIYSLKSFNNSLYATNSLGSLIKITKTNSKYYLSKINIVSESTSINNPLLLERHNSNLFVSFKDDSGIGKLIVPSLQDVFTDLKYNILLFEPYNFDVLADWQLVKNVSGDDFVNTSTNGASSTGIATAKLSNSGNLENIFSVNIQSYYSQIFYESTKTSVWFNRVSSFNELLGNIIDYSVYFNFVPTQGTQSAEINTFKSSLKIAFVFDGNDVKIYFAPGNTYILNGVNTLPVVQTNINDTVIFVKSQNDLLIYVNNILTKQYNSFFSYSNNLPVFRFGYIFEPDLTTNTFSLSYNTPFSDFNWYQIKFAFAKSALISSNNSEIIEITNNFSHKQPVRVLKELNGLLFAATKGLSNIPSNTTTQDASIKIFQLNDTENTWFDVTGIFENYQATSSNYIISSPNDIASIGFGTTSAFYVSGLAQNLASRNYTSPYILLGASTNYLYEEQTAYITALYPVNQNASGTYLYLTSSNNILSVPSSIYFSPTDIAKTFPVGVGSTSTAISANITATDGTNFSTVYCTVNPLILSAFTLSTSSFVGNSTALILANLTLPTKTISPRIVQITGSDFSLLSVSNLGFVTFAPNTNSLSILLTMGVATFKSKSVVFTANMPPPPNQKSQKTATINVYPHVLQIGYNTQNIVAGATDNPLIFSATLQTPVANSLGISYTSNFSGLATGAIPFIIPSGLASTQVPFIPSGFTTQNISGIVTFTIPGNISTVPVSFNSFTFSTYIDNLNPVFPYQTPRISYQLNNVPYNNLKIYNYVQQPAGVAVTFASFVTFATGQTLNSFTISTSINPGSGVAITAYGQLY